MLATETAHTILKEIWSKSAAFDGWFVGHYLLMPDHVHLFAPPIREAKSLAQWMKSWKSISSRRIAPAPSQSGPLWQSDYFDHFVRSPASYQQKWDYVQNNPVRQKLCLHNAGWPYQGTLHDLNPHFAG